MSEQEPVQFSVPQITAHIIRRLDDQLGELQCEISEEPDNFERGEEGDFIITSIPLVTHGESSLNGGELKGDEFFAALHLIHGRNDMGLWYVLEQLVLQSFNSGRDFERSQLGREPGTRDDERDEVLDEPDDATP